MNTPKMLGLAGLITLALAACSNQSVTELEVGDCFNTDLAGTEISQVPVVECTEAHNAEVYVVEDVSFEDYDATAIEDAVTIACTNNFEAYVGVSYEDSMYDVFYITPSSDTWAQGDREIMCAVSPTSGTITKSVKGSGE